MTTSQVSPVTHLGSHGKGNAYRWVYEGLTEISLASPTVGDGKMTAAGIPSAGGSFYNVAAPHPPLDCLYRTVRDTAGAPDWPG